MEEIFADFDIIVLEKDPSEPGVFLKARKPANWKPIDLSTIEIYSVILGKRTKDIPDISNAPLSRRFLIRILESKIKYIMPFSLVKLVSTYLGGGYRYAKNYAKTLQHQKK